ncbi:hypothetical protein [Sulfurimonas sp. NW9]|uniref:hypothetical protein n=1 Tax=Sulfurimonas sp. NW9 TaxID=2922728 RepID=UPI003DA8B013
MIEDKERWNIRHVEKPMRKNVEPIVEKYIDCAAGDRAWILPAELAEIRTF